MANMNLPVGVADKLARKYLQLSDLSRGQEMLTEDTTKAC
jgi:hypothetical protein